MMATETPLRDKPVTEIDLVRVAASRQTDILGCRLSLLAGKRLADQVAEWAKQGLHGHVCVSNTHMVVLAQKDRDLHNSMRDALAVTTDSQVLANAMRRLNRPYNDTVLYGPDLMHAIIARAANEGLSIALFGSTEQTCQAVRDRALRENPTLNIVAVECPPVMAVHELADDKTLAPLIQSQADIVLVSLGCPKQERWMHLVSDRLPAVSIGLGGAFDFYAGVRERSPEWVHRYSLEWLYRLMGDPRRLLMRYLVNNPHFVWLWLKARIRNSQA